MTTSAKSSLDLCVKLNDLALNNNCIIYMFRNDKSDAYLPGPVKLSTDMNCNVSWFQTIGKLNRNAASGKALCLYVKKDKATSSDKFQLLDF